MNTIGQRPQFNRAGKDDFFKKLVKEVQENVLKNKKLQRRNIFKAVGLFIAFTCFYSFTLIFGNNTPLLYTSYILMGLSMIVLFVNSFHDAAHGAVFPTKTQNRIF